MTTGHIESATPCSWAVVIRNTDGTSTELTVHPDDPDRRELPAFLHEGQAIDYDLEPNGGMNVRLPDTAST